MSLQILKISYSYFCLVWLTACWTPCLLWLGYLRPVHWNSDLLPSCTYWLCACHCARRCAVDRDCIFNKTDIVTTVMELTVLQWNLMFCSSSILPSLGDHPSLLPGAAPPLSTRSNPILSHHGLAKIPISEIMVFLCHGWTGTKKRKSVLPDGREVRCDVQEMLVSR